MFNFVIKKNKEAYISLNYIESLENEFSINFPDILKEYYLEYNGAEIKECRFSKYGLEFCVMLIVAINYGTMPFEKIVKFNRNNDSEYKNFFPLAVDEDEDEYYWDADTGAVYYLSFSNAEHPILICSSVEEFFFMLNKC